MTEVKEYNEDDFSVPAENLLNFIKFRRSIRQFKDQVEEFRALIFKNLNEKGQELLENLSPETMKFKKYAEMWINMYQNYQKNELENDLLFFQAPLLIIVSANSTVNAALASSNMELMANALDLGVLFSGFTVRTAHFTIKLVIEALK